MVRASPTAIWPIRSYASLRPRAPDGAAGWGWPLCRRSRRPMAESPASATIMVQPSPCPYRLIQRDRLPYLVPTRARQQRPLLQNSSRLLIEAPTAGVSDQDGHRTSAQVVQRETLEGLIVVARHVSSRRGAHVMGVAAEIGNEVAAATQVAAQCVRCHQRSWVIGRDASWAGNRKRSELIGQPAVESNVCPASRVPKQRSGGDHTNCDLCGSGSDQRDQATHRCPSRESNRRSGEAGEVWKPHRNDEQVEPLPQHQKYRKSGLTVTPGQGGTAEQHNNRGDRDGRRVRPTENV